MIFNKNEVKNLKTSYIAYKQAWIGILLKKRNEVKKSTIVIMPFSVYSYLISGKLY